MSANLSQMALVALVVLAAIVSLLVLFVLIRWLLRSRRRQVETGELKRDLMAWRNLHSLVQGGNEACQAKADLSSRLGQVRALFGLGLRQLHDEHGDGNLPWVLLLGEPNSGKSSLLAKSGLDLRACVRNDSGEKHSLMPWLGHEGFCLDVSGRVFFDRWLEGSGAEWDEVVSLVRRHHAKRPLDGIVLCVPADALIADDAALTREKTALVSAELRRLVTRVGANVPCHVVVTKCDMLFGWREYYATLPETERLRPFGWRNGKPADAFDGEAFTGWWRGAVDGLKAGLVARLLDTSSHETGVSRFATAGRAYLLPDSFDSLRTNLTAYLNRVFGVDACHGRDQLLLTGVFFTSAEDSGTVLSAELAKYVGKRPEEQTLQAKPVTSQEGLFVRSFLHDFVFGRKLAATYTARALFRRQLLGYAAVAALVCLAFIWVMASLRPHGELAARLARTTQFCEGVARHLSNGDLAASPLVKIDEKGVVRLLGDLPLCGNPSVTRLKYLHRAKSAAVSSEVAGFGWYTSSILCFGFNPNLGVSARRAIFNRVTAEMVFLPLVRCFEAHELSVTNSAFTEIRREAFSSYGEIPHALSADYRGGIGAGDFLNYLMPDVGPDIAQLLSSHYPGCGGSERDFCSLVAYDLEFVKVERRLVQDFFAAWRSLAIYPNAAYPILRDMLRQSQAVVRDGAEMQDMVRKLGADVPANAATLAAIRAKLLEQKRRMQGIDAHVGELTALFDAINDPGTSSEDKIGPLDGVDDPLALAIDDYARRLERDRREFIHDVRITTSQLNDRIASAYFKTLKPDTLEKRFAEIEQAFRREADLVRALAEEVRKSGVGRKIVNSKLEKTDSAVDVSQNSYVYDVMEDLYHAAISIIEADELTDPMQVGAALAKVSERETAAQAALTAAASTAAEDPTIKQQFETWRRFVTAQAAEHRVRILQKYVTLHPHSASEVGLLVSRLGAAETGAMADQRMLLRDSLGPMNFLDQFNDAGMRSVFGAYAEVRRLMNPTKTEKGDAKEAPLPPPEIPGYREMTAALDAYEAEYIKYCRDLPECLSADFGNDWASFRAKCGTIKPYAVNGALQTLYRQMLAGLKGIPTAGLSKDRAKDIESAIVLINRRLAILTTAFTETCIRQIGSWAVLPVDAALAAKRLREAPAKTLLADYLAVFGTDDKTNLPWWTTFFTRGLRLLQMAALEQGADMLKKEGGCFLRFPLCRDPVVDTALTEDALSAANDALLACGCTLPEEASKAADKTVPKTAGKPVPEVDETGNRLLGMVRGIAVLKDVHGNVRRPPVDLVRGSEMMKLIETLTVRKHETVWTLSVPSLAKRMELQRKYYPSCPLSTVRYRYGEVTFGGVSRAGVLSMDSSEELVFARGDLSDTDIRLKFFEFSDSSEPAAETTFSGPWAILRLYLTQGAVIDEGKKTVYLPLVIRDAYGFGAICWFSLKFNRPQPTPAEWPSTERWIDRPAK